MHGLFVAYDEVLRVCAALLAVTNIYWSLNPLAPKKPLPKALGVVLAVVVAVVCIAAVWM